MSDTDRIFIFVTNDLRNFIENSDDLKVDGTLKPSSIGFFQLITLQFIFFGRYRSLIFIPLKNKTERCYEKAFYLLKETKSSKMCYIT